MKQIHKKYDVIIVGGGHNGLVAASYLARAGKTVLLLEAQEELGGATTSVKPFPEYAARLSRYSYLVSIPDSLEGSQLKINLLLSRLPRLKSGVDPRLAFAGTFHVNELWGAETDDPHIYLAGAGARRGGGVSGTHRGISGADGKTSIHVCGLSVQPGFRLFGDYAVVALFPEQADETNHHYHAGRSSGHRGRHRRASRRPQREHSPQINIHSMRFVRRDGGWATVILSTNDNERARTLLADCLV